MRAQDAGPFIGLPVMRAVYEFGYMDPRTGARYRTPLDEIRARHDRWQTIGLYRTALDNLGDVACKPRGRAQSMVCDLKRSLAARFSDDTTGNPVPTRH